MTHWPQSLPAANGLLHFAGRLADAARSIILSGFRSGVLVNYKPDESPVTEVDREVEATIRDLIRAEFPNHGLIGEEYGADERPGEPCWIIDPIDGTKAFVTGRPLFGTLIGLLVDGIPVLGAIDAPVLSERWLGALDVPTMCNGIPVHTSPRTSLAESNLSATTIDMFDEIERRRFDTLSSEVSFRAFGGDCYSYGLLASGHVDIVVEASMNAYDYLPLVPVVNGAGGVMTDWNGDELTLSSGEARVLAAGNLALHRACLERLAG